MVAIFTYHNQKLQEAGSNRFQYQGIAFSPDKGRSWTKYQGSESDLDGAKKVSSSMKRAWKLPLLITPILLLKHMVMMAVNHLFRP